VQEKLKKIAEDTSKGLSLPIEYKLKSKINQIIIDLMQKSKLDSSKKEFLTRKPRYPYTLLYDR